jgi:hypothetical protein
MEPSAPAKRFAVREALRPRLIALQKPQHPRPEARGISPPNRPHGAIETRCDHGRLALPAAWRPAFSSPLVLGPGGAEQLVLCSVARGRCLQAGAPMFAVRPVSLSDRVSRTGFTRAKAPFPSHCRRYRETVVFRHGNVGNRPKADMAGNLRIPLL